MVTLKIVNFLGIFLVLQTLTIKCKKIDRPNYLTAYACEGNVLNMQCDDDHTISVIRANYGRFSISVCNEHGVSDWSVNCISDTSFRVLQERCSHRNNCSIRASTQVFGDPCPGTLKYLEAQYLCSEGSTTTLEPTIRTLPPWFIPKSTPSFDWLIPTSPSVNRTMALSKSTPTTASTESTTTTTISETSIKSTVDSVLVEWTSEVSKEKWTSSAETTSSVDEWSSTSTVTAMNLQNEYCIPIKARGLQWNWTKKGEIAVVLCPGGASGYATWQCSVNSAQWIPDTPDLSGCKSARISTLKEQLDRGESAVNVAQELARVTENRPLYGGDIITITELLSKMASLMADTLNSLHVITKEEMVKMLMKSVIATSSNLLDQQQRQSWSDLSRQEQLKAATALLIGLEENAYLLADQVNFEKVLVDADKNIMMTIKVYKVDSVQNIQFPTNEDFNNIVWDVASDTISLPIESISDRAENGLVKIIFFTFRNLQELLQPFRDDFWRDSQSNANVTRILNSRVISAMVSRGRNLPLRQPVTMTFHHLHNYNISYPVPVFWDYDTNLWSDVGCKVLATNRTHTVCSCNRLTNFAVLMDIQGMEYPPLHAIDLQVIVNVGCIVSIVCLAFSFATFAAFRALRCDRNTIHINLCICLLLSEIIFLLGIEQTDKRLLCGIVAALLHFSLLCVFSWIFLEAFQLYQMLMKFFESKNSKMRWYYILAYGIPALIVATSCVVDPFSYGTQQYCWLSIDNFFIFGFVGPAVIFLLVTLLFLNISIYLMCRHSKTSTVHQTKEMAMMANIRSWVRSELLLVCLLSLTWTSGLLYLNTKTAAVAFTFAVLNSLQGFFIFVVYCVQNEMAQKECKKLLCLSRSVTGYNKRGDKERDARFSVTSPGTSPFPVSNLNLAVQENRFKRLQEMESGKCSSIARLVSLPANAGAELEVEISSSKSSNKDSGHGSSDCEEFGFQFDVGQQYNRPFVGYRAVRSDLPEYSSSLIGPEGSVDGQQRARERHDHYSHQQLPVIHDPYTGGHRYRTFQTVHPVRNHMYVDVDGQDHQSEPVYDEIDSQRTQLPSNPNCDRQVGRRYKEPCPYDSRDVVDLRNCRSLQKTPRQRRGREEPNLPSLNSFSSEPTSNNMPQIKLLPSGQYKNESDRRGLVDTNRRGSIDSPEVHYPTDNLAVMAVVEGDKVVSKLQPPDLAKRSPCAKSGRLS